MPIYDLYAENSIFILSMQVTFKVVISLFIRVKHESFIALLIIFTVNCLARPEGLIANLKTTNILCHTMAMHCF